MSSVTDYDYELPPERIAQRPLEDRTAARLLVLDRKSGATAHRHVRDLPDLLQPGDCLVLNDTRVVPARLFGRRAATGGKWEGLFLGAAVDGTWRVIGQTRGRLQPGERIAVRPASDPEGEAELELELVSCEEEGVWTVRPQSDAPWLELLERFGTLPLPPYIGRKVADESDREQYQTTYAERPGAVAAPTAGLHFTPELLEQCRQQRVSIAYVTLHVGIGTFRPMAVEHLDEHVMHSEWCEVPAATANVIRETKERGGRVVAVGTTTVRTLESAALHHDPLEAWAGETDLFVRPPFRFRVVDALLTNFHLPKSTLLVLVSAFAGREAVLAAYEEAVQAGYRFYSYGDAMLIG